MDNPFHKQSTEPVLSSISLVDHSIGCNFNSTPIRFATSVATSISKPTILLFSSRKPIGGKLSSNPSTKVPLSKTFCKELSCAVPESAVPPFVFEDEPHPANTASIATIIIANTANDIFFIIFPPIDQSLSIIVLL